MIHDIAMLKLMGARNRVIVALILQQALLLGAMGYGLAYGIGLWVFPFFPRRVAVTQANLVQLGVVVLAISILSSFLGIWKAMSIQPNEILS
jgi:putative ABC transport system permease protein